MNLPLLCLKMPLSARVGISTRFLVWLIDGDFVCNAGAMLPFTSREDVDFFSHLEMHLRQEHPPLGGRDHMSYRGSYFPVSFRFPHTLNSTPPDAGFERVLTFQVADDILVCVSR